MEMMRLVWLALWWYAPVLGQVSPSSQCPAPQEITPCQCQVKKSGLDVMCEFTDNFHISKALTVLKGRPNIVVFYLKLRHNNLPKLQSFVFLGIDIRHLTVHNSSLALVEESSLSSMGKPLFKHFISSYKRILLATLRKSIDKLINVYPCTIA